MATYSGTPCPLYGGHHRAADYAVALDVDRAPYTTLRSFFPAGGCVGAGPVSGDGVVDEIPAEWSGTLCGYDMPYRAPRTYAGVRAPGVRNDIFDRLYLYPSAIDVGNLTGNVTRDLSIWNTFEDTVVCTDVERIGMDGISTTFNYSGFSIGGMSALLKQAIIDMDGPPIIDGQLLFTFTVGTQVLSARITFAGRRIVAWVWMPTGPSNPMVTERLEWFTDILTSRDRTEQRRQLRNAPRQSWKITAHLRTNAEAARLDTALYGWQGRSWAMPVWSEQVSVAGPLAAGLSGLDVDTTRGDFRQGSMCMLWQSAEVNEILVVSGVMDTHLSFTLPSSVAFDADKVLMLPVRTARIVETPRREDHVSGGATFSARFLASDNVELDTDPSDNQYLDEDVLPDPLLAAGGVVRRDLQRPIDTLDFRTGLAWYDDPGDYTSGAYEYRFVLRNRDDVWQFRRWLHRRAGRLRPFWVPSWREDLTLLDGIQQADASLRVADMGYARLLVGNPVRRHICVMLRDGTRIVRKVTGAATGNPGEEVISVESAWGVDAEPADIARVCWWLRLRANADAIEVQHIRAGVATCAVPVIEIRDEV